MSETKVEHAKLLVNQGIDTRFSLKDALFLSKNSTPRISRLSSCRSTVTALRDSFDEGKQNHF